MEKTPFQLTNNISNALFSILGILALFAPDKFIDIRFKFNIYTIIISFAFIYFFIFLSVTIFLYILKTKKWEKKQTIYVLIILICTCGYYYYCISNTSVSFLSFKKIEKIVFSKDKNFLNTEQFELGKNIKELTDYRYQITDLIKTDKYFISIEFSDGKTIEINKPLTGFVQTINVKHLGR